MMLEAIRFHTLTLSEPHIHISMSLVCVDEIRLLGSDMFGAVLGGYAVANVSELRTTRKSRDKLVVWIRTGKNLGAPGP